VTAPFNDFIYVAPAGIDIDQLYHKPPRENLVYFGAPMKASPHEVIWTRAINPAPGPGFSAAIHPNRGDISAMGDDNAGAGNYIIDITATADCGASDMDSFMLQLRPNEWCGDMVLQPPYLEECDADPILGIGDMGALIDCPAHGFDGGQIECRGCQYYLGNCCFVDCGAAQCGPDVSGCGGCPDICGANTNCNTTGGPGTGFCECDVLNGWEDCSGPGGTGIDADGCECRTGVGFNQRCVDTDADGIDECVDCCVVGGAPIGGCVICP